MGYSIFAIHNLQPSPRDWDLTKLRDFASTQKISDLDPYLNMLIIQYINGDIDRISGFQITEDIESSRMAKTGQLGFGFPPKEQPPTKTIAPPQTHRRHPQTPL